MRYPKRYALGPVGHGTQYVFPNRQLERAIHMARTERRWALKHGPVRVLRPGDPDYPEDLAQRTTKPPSP